MKFSRSVIYILTISIAVILIGSIKCGFKFLNIDIQILSDGFGQNLITEIIGLTISILLIELFAFKLLVKFEINEHKAIYRFISIRLDSINHRISQKLILMNIDTTKAFPSQDKLIENIDLKYINQKESRSFFQNNSIVTVSKVRPVLFFEEITPIFLELDLIQKYFDRNIPVEAIEGAMNILSKDTYLWNIFQAPVAEYNSAWLNSFKDMLFKIYTGSISLKNGNEKLKQMIN